PLPADRARVPSHRPRCAPYPASNRPDLLLGAEPGARRRATLLPRVLKADLLGCTGRLLHGERTTMAEPPRSEFEKAAAEQGGENVVGECLDSLRHNKKWWLLPIVVVLLLLGVLILLSSTAAAPFIYTLF